MHPNCIDVKKWNVHILEIDEIQAFDTFQYGND